MWNMAYSFFRPPHESPLYTAARFSALDCEKKVSIIKHWAGQAARFSSAICFGTC